MRGWRSGQLLSSLYNYFVHILLTILLVTQSGPSSKSFNFGKMITLNCFKTLPGSSREYWMIPKGPGFLAVVWFGSSPTPFPPLLSASCLFFLSLPVCRRSSLLTGEGGGGGGGAKSYDGEKAWLSINHSILSVQGEQNNRNIRERMKIMVHS